MRIPSIEDLAVLRAIHEGVVPGYYLDAKTSADAHVNRLLEDGLAFFSEDDQHKLVSSALGGVVYDHVDLARLPGRKFRHHGGLRQWMKAGLNRAALLHAGDTVRIVAVASRDPMRPYHGLVAEVSAFMTDSVEHVAVTFDNPATGRRKSLHQHIDGLDLVGGHIFEMARKADFSSDADAITPCMSPAF